VRLPDDGFGIVADAARCSFAEVSRVTQDFRPIKMPTL